MEYWFKELNDRLSLVVQKRKNDMQVIDRYVLDVYW